MSNLTITLHGTFGFAEFRLIDSEGQVERFFIPASKLTDDRVVISVASVTAHNVYFSVVPRTEMRGTRDACGSANAVWCDYDNDESEPDWNLPPSALVRTSPGRWQAYWFLDSPLRDLDQLEAINRSIANAEGGDLQATDRARVLRLPGSYNLKYPEKPHVMLEYWNPDLRYSVEELCHAYPPTSLSPRRLNGVAHGPGPVWLPLIFDAIVDFLERSGFRPRISGNRAVALCPLHDDRNPSLSLHAERGWYCHAGCGQGRLTRLANILGVRV